MTFNENLLCSGHYFGLFTFINSWNPLIVLWGICICYYHGHFVDEETATQRDEVTCPRLCRKFRLNGPKVSGPRASALNHHAYCHYPRKHQPHFHQWIRPKDQKRTPMLLYTITIFLIKISEMPFQWLQYAGDQVASCKMLCRIPLYLDQSWAAPQPDLSPEIVFSISITCCPQRHPHKDQCLWIYPMQKLIQSLLSQFL